jgi:hydrogenase maturation protein HypF
MVRTRFRVTGTVQGVGFRPFVYRRATELGLSGFVRNDSAGVVIEVEGDRAAIAALADALLEDAPPLACIQSVSTEDVEPRWDIRGFTIERSEDIGTPAVPVTIDTAPCPACLSEVFDPADRRHRYPFANCTDCGPRYTIVRSVPYDRPATTMAGFVMCAACQCEYDDPGDRRFHAQPNACPACGPQVSWLDPTGRRVARADAAVGAAVAAMRDGGVIAVKGVGGYHLAADACSVSAIGELRRRKHRDDKPFAVMVPDLADAERLCVLDPVAIALISSPRRPIVLAARRQPSPIVEAVAPDLPELGVMLPYSPLHHLLLEGFGGPLVMTSGNLRDEPIAHDDDDAISRLGPLTDGLLSHDRPIHIRCDDSVARAVSGRVQLLRRSRGYAPEPVPLPFDASSVAVLAVGAELKNTVAVTKGSHVVASHHIGDLEHIATYASFLQAVEHLPALHGVVPDLVAHDLHPEYLSTKFAVELDRPLIGVQHHHAHAASCMVEHGRVAPVLAVCFDGLGFGSDGTLWGGEFLVADLAGFRRVGHLRPVVMPGGAAAIREPWRMAASWLATANGADAAVGRLTAVDRRAGAVVGLVEHQYGPTTTAVGRLFDSVAVLLGGRATVTFEAQAAIELEAAARTVPRTAVPSSYGELIVSGEDHGVTVLDPSPLLATLVADVDAGVPVTLLAAAFHEALGTATGAVAASLAAANNVDTVALTGGVFQNVRLTEVVESTLREAGCEVFVHGQIPANDGGISIGQAAIAAWRSTDGRVADGVAASSHLLS